MSTHKHFDKICCVVLAVTLLLTVLFMNAESFGVQKASTVMGYENKLFDTSAVHTIDIIMEDWEEFTANCKSEEYYACSVVIDNEAYKNVAIRGKGNTSLTQVASYGNDRYSFKIEFDHYDSTNTYYGLDKLCLNNIIQDNTYMKDYLAYQMMAEMGVSSPLCSYVYITVNGEDWGLYIAVEGVEKSFLQRNYGNNYGELYKPDSQSMGGGRGNGEKFDMDDFLGNTEDADTSTTTQDTTSSNTDQTTPQMPGNMQVRQMPGENMQGGQSQGGTTPPELPSGETAVEPNAGNAQGGMTPPNNETTTDGSTSDTNGQMQQGGTVPEMGGQIPGGDMQGGDKGGMTNGSDDVLLKYIDDEIESYANIFDNAKTDVSDSDKARLIAALKKLSNGEELEDTVDIEKVIRYFVVHNFVLNFDSYTGSMIHNYYLYEKDGQMQMVPWDYNLAFGGFESAGGATNLVNYPVDSPVSGGNTEDRPMIAWIFENEEYTELYHKYFSEFIVTYFDSGYFSEMIDNVNAMISPYVEKDPTKFCTYEEFEKGITTLKEFCLLRAESVSAQLDGTIGSTSDTQKSDTLIDAGDIQINDMGSMGNTMGGGKDKFDGNTQKPQTDAEDNETTESTDKTPSGESDATENGSSEDSSISQMPDGQMPNGNQGGFGGEQMQGGAPPELPDGENGDFGGQMQRPDGNAQPNSNGQTQPQGQNTVPATDWIVMIVSVLFLALGLVFAFVFKRRK